MSMLSLTQAQLKLIAFKCGLATSGTKAILFDRIKHELNGILLPSEKSQRILSLDVGIRNLAYCTLDIDPKLPSPKVHAWQHISMSVSPVACSVRGPEEQESQIKETFDPATMSRMAYNLLRQKLLLDQPTHVIIERQRFRSMSAKQILEWTLRVNMFEAILHAVLTTLQAEGIWNGTVATVMPLRVGPFWLSQDDYSNQKNSQNRLELNNKRKKIELVRNWLKYGNPNLILGNEEVENVAKFFLKMGRNSRRSVKDRNGEVIKIKAVKLDDLTDSLLQGLAWIQWEKNKRIALRNGIKGLLDV